MNLLQIRHVRPRRVTLAVMLALAANQSAASEPGQTLFNERFLDVGGGEHADLSIFAFGNRVTAGTYVPDVAVNGRNVGKQELRFIERSAGADAVPCLTPPMLSEWGVNTAVFPALQGHDDQCVDLPAIIPNSEVNYDGGKQRLELSVPQAAMKREARGAVDPSRWERGIEAGMIDYQISGAQYTGSRYRQLDRNVALFGAARMGVNIGDWRIRHASNYVRSLNGTPRWQALDTYAQRDLAGWRSQLTLGDSSTSGALFDAFQFRGVQLTSDDAMLPDSLQGYAPTIRGVAQTNAQVTVRQNGYTIYSTYVPPGPFVIDDLYPAIGNGDMEVTITEADGRETKFVQPFAALPTLLRDGAWRYSATAGEYRAGLHNDDAHPVFIQGTVARGLGREYTAYAGMTGADLYQSVMFGFGKNMLDFGAISADLTHARTQRQDQFRQIHTGQSLRFLYAKSFPLSSTNFQLAGYRYSTRDFRTFPEAVRMANWGGGPLFATRRTKVEAFLTQRVGTQGSLSLTANRQTYWGTNKSTSFLQVGYFGAYKRLSYGTYLSQYSNLDGPSSQQVSLTLSIPLGSTSTTGNYNVTRGSQGVLSQQASVHGSAYDARLNYNATVGRSRGNGSNTTTTTSVSTAYLSPVGRLDLGRSQGAGYGQNTFGFAGGAVAHRGGVTLAPSLGDTVALIHAPGAAGVGFNINPGVRTDRSGYAVLPYLSPYRLNRIELRTADLGNNIDVANAALEVVPTRGAVVYTKFATQVGYRLLMTLTDKKGRVLPFGSKIENDKGQEVGVVGQDGQAYVAGARESGTLKVSWGLDDAEQCKVPYTVPPETSSSATPVVEMLGQCS
jgi:outer membrane usher protein